MFDSAGRKVQQLCREQQPLVLHADHHSQQRHCRPPASFALLLSALLPHQRRIAASSMSLCPLQQKEQDASSKHSKQHLLLGTHTSEGEQNYLMRAEVTLPLEEDEHNDAGYDEERGEVQC